MNEPSIENVNNRERARVVSVELSTDDNSRARLWVEVFAKNTCGDCSASSTCGQGALSRWFTRKSRCYPIECSRDEVALLSVGRWVDVEVPEGVLARVSLLVFILPLVAMIAGAFLASMVNNHELSVAVGGVLGFYLGIHAVRWIETSSLLSVPQPRLCP